MERKLEEAQDKFIDYISRLCNSFGLNHFVARLYALLYLSSKDKMSLDEIRDVLKVSKGNVSVNIRILESWGAVTKVWVKGSRKDYYKANPDIEKVFLGKIKQAVTKRLDEASVMIDGFKNTLEAENADFSKEEQKTAKVYLDRLKRIERIKNNLTRLMAVANTVIKL